jgi:hypothetical protein
MIATTTALQTEVRGLELSLHNAELHLSANGQDVIAPVTLSAEDAERLRLEMAKSQLFEWNRLQELQDRARLRYRRYLGSWLVLALAAFSAYVSYPSYMLCVLLLAGSMFLWWRAAREERRAEHEDQSLRNEFRPDWDYIRERLEETDSAM